LGLSKCWRIITLHGGKVGVADRAPPGTTIQLDLPQLRG
jgi:K+-sensing histidine kinase KdpD